MPQLSLTAKNSKLGEKFASILEDDASRARFMDNPAATLPEAGLSSNVTVYADTADTVHLVVPADVDRARVAADDEAYFEELGRLALGACIYKDIDE